MHLYQEFAPHPLLAAHVACLWTSRALPQASRPVRTRVLPDNCIDILWQDRAPFGFVAGMMSRAHRVEMAQPVLTVAVRFLPGAARAFFDVPLHLLQDAHPGLDELWPRCEAEALAAALWEREQTIEDWRVGLSAKTFAMVCQFRHAHAALRSLATRDVDWTRLAADCGYYDQSHLIHAFRQFADDTPASFHFSNTRT